MKLGLILIPGLLLAQTEWTVPPEFHAAGYVKEAHLEGAVLSGPGPSGAMTQTFDATPYRGQQVRLRATVRVVGAGKAQLLLRVDRPGELGFFDNMGDRPISTAEWKTVEIEGEIAPDARSIEAGVLSSAKAVWVKDIVFEKVSPPAPEELAARDAVHDLYARLDEAYAAGDFDVVAGMALPDARIVLPGGVSPVSKLLDQLKGVKVQSRSTVTATRFRNGTATVWVNNESSVGGQAVFSSNRDTWLLGPGGWKLQESTLIATRPITPADVLAQIHERAGMPGFDDVRIVLWEGPSAPAIPGFTAESADPDPVAAARQALAYLNEHAPEEAGPAELAFQNDDAARLAGVVRVFDAHPAQTADWLYARQAAMVVYQSHAMRDRRDEAMAANVIWLASQAHPSGKIVVAAPNAAAIAPFVRQRYGRQVYVVGAIARELLGGDLFLDLRSVPAGTPLARWLAAQKFPFDGLIGSAGN
jgi:hypothetical protein